MKTRVLVAFFVTMAMATGTLKSQNNPNAYAQVVEPQYINSFYALTPNGNFIDLEYKNVVLHPKSWAVPGYASVKTVADFEPGQSPIRLPASAQFVVRGRTNVNPATIYEPRLLKGSKSHREFVMSQAHGSIVGGAVNPEEGAILIRFEELWHLFLPHYPGATASARRVRPDGAWALFPALLLWRGRSREAVSGRVSRVTQSCHL